MTEIHHIGIVVDDIDKYVELFTGLGGQVEYSGTAEAFEAICVFIKFDNIYVELVKGSVPKNHLNKFVDKYGEGLHHIALIDESIEGVPGALPNMKVAFNRPDEECRLLLEKVRFDDAV